MSSLTEVTWTCVAPVYTVSLYSDPWIWNQEYRFINLSLDKESTVVYVGANTWGGDGKELMDMFNW